MEELKPYAGYKAFGQPWLDKIPAHWDVKRGKSIFRCIDIRSETGKEELLTVSAAHGVIPRRTATVTMFKAESYVGYKLCWPDDLAINSLWAWGRGLGVAKHHGIVSSAYGVYRLRDRERMVPAYVDAYVRSEPFNWELRVRSKGIWISRLQLTDESFLDAPILMPPPDEQAAIARFLAALDGRVNRFVRAKRRLIELLTEQKQAIITHAVTRGLNPYAKLKPSGIDWLGDVPEHWEVKRCVQLFRERVERGRDGLPILSVSLNTGVTVAGDLDEDGRERKLITDITQYKFTATGDIAYNTMRMWQGAVGVVPQDGLVSPAYVVAARRSEIAPEYYGLVFRTPHCLQEFNRQSRGIVTDRNRLYWDQFKQVFLPVPPHDEQRAIIESVEGQTRQIETSISAIVREIALIREYRTRLVADVVTGKLDVRSALAEESSIVEIKPKANIHFQRSVFAAEIIHRLHAEPTFGHVKFEKLMFLCEKRCGVNTGSTYHRDAAGPYDNRAIRSIDSQIKKHKWYEARRGEKGYRYLALEKAGAHRAYFERYYVMVRAKFDEVINTFRTFSTEQCEIVATLYSAWEDLLAKGAATDEQIIDQVLNHWHVNKKKIEEERWRRALGWMKRKGFTPTVAEGA